MQDGKIHVFRRGYLAAIERGWCVLVVENERPVVLMPPESPRRLAGVFRWHLAESFNGQAFDPESVTGGWAALLIPAHLSESDVLQRRPLAVPSDSTDAMMFRYRMACAEDACRKPLGDWLTQAERAQTALAALCTLIDVDSRHHEGKPWPALVALLDDDRSEPGKRMRAYRREYSRAANGPDTKTDAMRVFWDWARLGAPTARSWCAWSGMLEDIAGPDLTGSIVNPIEWLWMPSWGLMADELAVVVTMQYLAAVPTHSPVQAAADITLAGLHRQGAWLTAAAAAAHAIIEIGDHWHPVPSPRGGKPIDMPLRWLVQTAHRLSVTSDALTDLLVGHRDVLPDWAGITRSTIKKRLERSWQSHLRAPPIDF